MKMNSLERFTETLRWQPTDRCCCLPLVFGYAANIAEIEIKDAISDTEALVSSQLLAQRLFGYDAVYVYGGNAVEIESLGIPLVFPDGDYPYPDPRYDLKNPDELLAKPLPDPVSHGRIPKLLSAAGKLRQEVDGSVPVVGVIAGPFTIAAQVLGLEKLLLLLVDDPDKIQKLLHNVSILSQNFALALLTAGAQVIMIMDPVSSQSIITPGIFRNFSFPLLRGIFKGCRRAGALACWLAITGRTDGFFKLYPDTGADLVTLDYEVSMEKAFSLLPRLVIQGNIRPFDFVERGPGEIRRECLDLLQLAQARPGYILGTGCELPLNSKQENLEAMMDVLSLPFQGKG